ncbi:uncharacterized protein LOC128951529 [Oppia nitens]|uniref:uncharacterized protein LOC128951529 n=1 Tax=Oppia nitens TaxID=1686743 RepID=UPI0023DC20F9|nr:uncharacterized protein LOC128951529 [Oppia nitens]
MGQPQSKSSKQKHAINAMLSIVIDDDNHNEYPNNNNNNNNNNNTTIDDNDNDDPQVREAIRLSKLEEEERLKIIKLQELRESLKWDLRESLATIILGQDLSQQKLWDMKTLLLNYELSSGQSIYPGYQIKHIRNSTVNDISKLIICVIRGLGGQVSMKVVATYFAEHLVRIWMKFQFKKQLILYDPTVHRLDPEAQMNKESSALNDTLVCVHINDNGNGLWSSVSISMYGSDEYMESLRLLTASTLLDYRPSFEQSYRTTESDIAYDELISRAVTLDECAHELHIQALSLALQRPIYLYSGSFGSLVERTYDRTYCQTYDQLRESYESDFVYDHMRFLADGNREDEIPVLLYYNGSDRYSPVLPKRVGVRPLRPYTEMMKPMFNRKVVLHCKLCLDDIPKDKCQQFTGCRHQFCTVCLAQYFDSQITDGRVHHIKCPDDQCTGSSGSGEASYELVCKLLSRKSLVRYHKLLLKKTVDVMDDMAYCPKCNDSVEIDNSRRYGYCLDCDYAFCTSCHRKYHGQQRTCTEALEDQVNRAVENRESVDYIRTHFKQCPKCQIWCEKIDGCNHMQCKMCMIHFCWLCLMDITDNEEIQIGHWSANCRLFDYDNIVG